MIGHTVNSMYTNAHTLTLPPDELKQHRLDLVRNLGLVITSVPHEMIEEFGVISHTRQCTTAITIADTQATMP